MSKNKILGKFGENEACKYLVNNNYIIIEKNFRYKKYSEVDIIAKYKDTLCFIEVKTRSNNLFGSPAESINYKKISKMRVMSQIYCDINKIYDSNIRFDVIEIYVENNYIKNINLIINAF